MPDDSSVNPADAPLSPAVRNRLQKLFEHATANAEKSAYDYAHELFTQCVAGDPANFVYLQAMLANLQKKYHNNKKGGKLAGLKGSGARKAMKHALGASEWKGAIKAGCDMLKLNPWDPPTLIGMADACHQLGIDECQLYYLRWALNADPHSVEVNKLAAEQLTRMGQFDQAIVCWHRVEEAKPGNEEAAKAISTLTVEKTIQQGGYDRDELLGEGAREHSPAAGKTAARPTPSAKPAATETVDEPEEPPKSPEERLSEAIDGDPTNVANYLDLAELFVHGHRFDEAEQLLGRALQASGGGDLSVRERLEDVHLRRGRQQVEIAEKRATEEKTDEAVNLAQQMRADLNQQELQVYAARCQRNPNSTSLRYELGLRLKRAGKFPEAIQAFQAAREDARRKARVHLELGECFQKIEQYKLAMKEYETAIEVCGDRDEELKKLSLYRAGVLGTGLRDLERAERHLDDLAMLDFGYKDVAQRLDKINRLRDSG
jgi:tetratricopeptide (TPR) repeat protein